MSELDKGKASKTVYPDGVTEIKDDARHYNWEKINRIRDSFPQ